VEACDVLLICSRTASGTILIRAILTEGEDDLYNSCFAQIASEDTDVFLPIFLTVEYKMVEV
jgi:hypothetical protein